MLCRTHPCAHTPLRTGPRLLCYLPLGIWCNRPVLRVLALHSVISLQGSAPEKRPDKGPEMSVQAGCHVLSGVVDTAKHLGWAGPNCRASTGRNHIAIKSDEIDVLIYSGVHDTIGEKTAPAMTNVSLCFVKLVTDKCVCV